MKCCCSYDLVLFPLLRAQIVAVTMPSPFTMSAPTWCMFWSTLSTIWNPMAEASFSNALKLQTLMMILWSPDFLGLLRFLCNKFSQKLLLQATQKLWTETRVKLVWKQVQFWIPLHQKKGNYQLFVSGRGWLPSWTTNLAKWRKITLRSKSKTETIKMLIGEWKEPDKWIFLSVWVLHRSM